MRRTVVGCWFLCALTALLTNTKGEIPENLLHQPFSETFSDVQDDFLRNDLLYSKYGYTFDLAGFMCRSARRNVKDYCNLEHLILQLNVLQTNVLGIRKHEDRRFIGGNADVELEQYLEALDASAQLNLLAVDLKVGINMVLETTVAVARSMGKYFQNCAEFDMQIAQADIAFIDQQLDRLNEEGEKYFGDTPGSIGHKLSKILTCAIAGLALQLTDEVIKLSFTAAQAYNPFGHLFGGFDINSLFDRIEAIFDTTMSLALIARFKGQMDTVRAKINDITTKFNANSEYLGKVMTLINSTDALDFDEVMAHKDEFLNLYQEYSPAVTEQDLVELLATITYMLEETCAIVDELSASSSPPIIAAIGPVRDEAKKNCQTATVDIAVLDSYYNQIYEFQFDLMDSLAATMKAIVALANANNFLTDFDTEYINLATTSIGLVMDSVSVQAVAHSYCSVIEYERAGVRPLVCQRLTFTPVDRQSIKSLARPDCYGRYLFDSDDCTTRDYAYLPTIHEHSVGKQHIDVKELLDGVPQYVTIPSNATWLRKYHWMDKFEEPSYEKTYFLKRLQVYVPGLACKNPVDPLGAKMEIKNGVTVRLHIEDSDHDGSGVPGYMMKPLIYPFKWDKRFGSCDDSIQTFRQRKRDETAETEVEVCVRTSGRPPTYDNDMYPSLFTTWEVTLKNTDCELTIPDIDNYDYDLSVFYEMVKWEHSTAGGSAECWPNPCQSGGVCKEGLNTYTCQCPESTSGKNCENGVNVGNTCDRTYNAAAFRPTGMYILPQPERKFSYFAVDGDTNTCAESKETYTPWFYVELPWHAVLCEVRITGTLPTEEHNQVKVALSKHRPSGNSLTQLKDAIHAEEVKPSSSGVYTVGFPTYIMADLYHYLVIYEPDLRKKSTLRICDVQAYCYNGAFNKIGQSSFNDMTCDWQNNILPSTAGSPSQISTAFNGAERAIDSDVTTCSKTETTTGDVKPWWAFTFQEEANQVCGLKLTLPEFVLSSEASEIWAGLYFSDEPLQVGQKIDLDYFRPCGEKMILDDITADILTANCDVLAMNGTQLIIYGSGVDSYLSLCDVQVFVMKKVNMVP